MFSECFCFLLFRSRVFQDPGQRPVSSTWFTPLLLNNFIIGITKVGFVSFTFIHVNQKCIFAEIQFESYRCALFPCCGPSCMERVFIWSESDLRGALLEAVISQPEQGTKTHNPDLSMRWRTEQARKNIDYAKFIDIRSFATFRSLSRIHVKDVG